MIPIQAKLTIIPANKTPKIIAGKANRNLMPKRKAATLPVQAPVTGKGIMTNRTNPKASYFSTKRERLRVRENHQEKNLSNGLNLLKNLETGPKNKRRGTTGIIFPITDRT
jgi:hypothetical protein